MKHLFCLMLVLLSVICCTASVCAQVASEQELLQLETKIADATLRRDTKFLAGVYADGFVRTDPSSGELTKEQWLARLKSNTDKIESVVVSDANVRFFGDVAIVTGRMTTQGRNPETGPNQRYQRLDRFTHTFVKQNGTWRMLASHASVFASYGIHQDW